MGQWEATARGYQKLLDEIGETLGLKFPDNTDIKNAVARLVREKSQTADEQLAEAVVKHLTADEEVAEMRLTLNETRASGFKGTLAERTRRLIDLITHEKSEAGHYSDRVEQWLRNRPRRGE